MFVDRNVIVYDSGAGGMFLFHSMTGEDTMYVTEFNEYLPDDSKSKIDGVYSIGDIKIQDKNNLTTCHPYEVNGLKKLAKELGLHVKFTAITFGTTQLDIKCKFYIEVLFEIKKRNWVNQDNLISRDWTNRVLESIAKKEKIFLQANDWSWDYTVDYKKLFADADLDEVTNLIKYTNQSVEPVELQRKIRYYTQKNIEVIYKWAPHLEGYFQNGE